MSSQSAAYICGIDAGQTSTRCAIAQADGTLLGEGRGGALIHLSAAGSREIFLKAMRTALDDAWRAADLPPQPLAALVLGATGIEANTPEAATANELLTTLVATPQIQVCSDALTALYGAHGGRPGVMVISGTGSIALGMDRHGTYARAGGWGWLLSDEGSAFAIGQAGLLAALYAFDGFGPATQLEAALVDHFQLGDLRDIKRIVYAADFGSKGFAGLAPFVAMAAQQGDAVAEKIIQTAGEALAQIAVAVIQKLDFVDEIVPVAPVSGAFAHIEGLKGAFAAAMKKAPVANRVVEAEMSALVGAVMMARQGVKKQE